MPDQQIKIFKVELSQTNNWHGGNPEDYKAKKTLCAVTFLDEKGTVFTWVPAKWETNMLLGIARYMIHAEDINFPLLKNPEPRPDIDELRVFLKAIDEAKK